jgi:hypothetical protein
MAPSILFVALLVAAGIAGLFVTIAARSSRGSMREAFEARCATLGFVPLSGASSLYLACGGEVGDLRVVLMLIRASGASQRLGPRVDVLVESRLSLPIPSGGVLLQPGKEPELSGGPALTGVLSAALTPGLKARVAERLGGRFAFSSLDSLAQTAALRLLIRSKWPEPWRGLLLQTWVPVAAEAPAIKAAIDGLAAVREALAKAPRVSS